MKQSVELCHRFVDSVPENMDGGVIYVSVKYRSVMHLCACGCGSEVVTPLSPTDWRLTFDGVSVSLDPSVGNWSLACRPHYFIRGNKAVWASDMSDEWVAAGREWDRKNKECYFSDQKLETKSLDKPAQPPNAASEGFLDRAFKFFFGGPAGK